MGFADAFRPLQALAASRAEAQNAASLLRDSQAYAAKLRAEAREQKLQDDEPDNALKGFKRYRPGMMSGATAATAQAIGNAPVGPMAGLMRAGGDAVRLKGMADAAAEAPTWIQTGLSLQEKRDAADDKARRELAVQAQQAAKDRADADRASREGIATENNATRRQLTEATNATRQAANAQRVGPALQLKEKYEGHIKPFREQVSAYAKMQSLAGPNVPVSPQNDQALIFAFMKTLDPTSTVREGEYASVKNATGIPERVKNMYKSALDGTILNPAQRKELLTTARNMVESQRGPAGELTTQYRGMAKAYGLDPELLINDPFQSSKPAPNVNNDAPPPPRRAGETPKQYFARTGIRL